MNADEQQKMIHWWLDEYTKNAVLWQSWLTHVSSNAEQYDLNQHDRTLFDQMANQHSEMMQGMLTLYLQNISLFAELSERWMSLSTRMLGINT